MDQSQISKLIRKRGSIKGSITRIKNYVDAFNQETGSSLHALRVRYDAVSGLESKYDEIQTELEVEDTNSDHTADREEVETTVYSLKAKIQELLTPDQTTSPSTSRASSLNEVTNIKLPAIKLPTFNGNYEDWIPFADNYKLLVHDNDSLGTIQKFHYLLSSVQGSAKSLIQHLPTTETNYNVAWELLSSRFENKKIITSKYVRDILNIKPVQGESASDLKGFINTFSSNLQALKALPLDQPLEEIILTQHVLDRIDADTRRSWELETSPTEIPSLQQLLKFLEQKCMALENIQTNVKVQNKSQASKPTTFRNKTPAYSHLTSIDTHCACCKQEHKSGLFACPRFQELSPQQRSQFVREKSLCYNCLKQGHTVKQCTSSKCRKCDRKHNSLLHEDINSSNHVNQHTSQKVTIASVHTDRKSYSCKFNKPYILLSTAVVKIKDSNGSFHKVRALLDSGSQTHLITEDIANKLKLRRNKDNTAIAGINNASSTMKHSVDIEIHSTATPYKAKMNCLVVPKITGQMPSVQLDYKPWNIPSNITLADPHFYHPGNVDLLIGAELFYNILKAEQMLREGDYPVLQETHLGWVVSGNCQQENQVSNNTVNSFLIKTEENLDQQLRKFWEIEELDTKPRTLEEQKCMQHFKDTTTRDSSGRFIVRLPLKENHQPLGRSFEQARQRFQLLEQKFQRQPKLCEEYVHFMTEYEELGHMTEADTIDSDNTVCYYLPHHAVFKPDSTTTATRVVFDGSAKTSTGIALNNILMVGPTVQQDLYSITLRFRTHQIAFTADITKMYRQIRMHKEDTRFQRILWRKSQEESLKTYELQTVTYGTASAPFSATQCLNQLAEEEGGVYPAAAQVLQRDFYVDDVLSGASNINEALQIQNELIDVLNKGGFPIKKWCSNHPALLEALPDSDRHAASPFHFDGKGTVKTLGLSWHPTSDKLLIANKIRHVEANQITKRTTTSVVASIFDPLGLISPLVIQYKMFLQKLWLQHIDWDSSLKNDLRLEWIKLENQLRHISSIQVDRLVTIQGILTSIQIHGFSDASEQAYGACIYIRSVNHHGEIQVRLLCSKSRVAPVKKITIPRLELLGATLLARLMKKAMSVLNLDIDEVYLWTDSNIVLSWVEAPASRWKTFVGNRVAQIQELTETKNWHHVQSVHNPADLISRGVSAQNLQSCLLWWEGPAWLSEPSSEWPQSEHIKETSLTALEQRQVKTVLVIDRQDSIIHKFSSLTKLQRVVSYCCRFVHNASKPKVKKTGPLTVQELQRALEICIRLAQNEAFGEDIAKLRTRGVLPKKSQIRNLCPFLSNGLLRVGGRLANTSLPFSTKHQIVLPPKHHITELIIQHAHQQQAHAGSELLLSILRDNYWIPNGRNIVRHQIHKCVRCYRLKGITMQQIMADYPKPRVQPAPPFKICGIDYGGPVLLRPVNKRSNVRLKSYIALFVCFATKAIHIELVSDLTTQSFLAALRRFISRRGRPTDIYSDNATTFVGADKELQDLHNFITVTRVQDDITNDMANKGIKWHFIPPRSPHFGGLWEAGIKSVKYHLRRVIGNCALTFEEMYTVLTQIEACLNSRPITTLSSDPSDPAALTPSHFLVGNSLTAIPDPDLTLVPSNKLKLWKRIQQLVQHFWSRWHKDYLTQLQQRPKWTNKQTNLQIGTVVAIKDDNLPPLKWKLAVVTELHPGADGVVRVATLRTSHGEVKRSIVKLSPLPVE